MSMSTLEISTSRPQPDRSLPPLDDPTARTLLAAAHAQLYKWPPTFTGYQARLLVNDNGIRYAGSVSVRLGHGTHIHLDGDEALATWVRECLWTQARRLADIPFAEGVGRYGITFASTQEEGKSSPRGRQLLLRDGPQPTRYWVRDGRYWQIERQEPNGARRVDIIERYDMAPDGRRYVTHSVTTHFSAPKGARTAVESYVNEFIWSGDVLFPCRRTVTDAVAGAIRTREITLSGHIRIAE